MKSVLTSVKEMPLTEFERISAKVFIVFFVFSHFRWSRVWPTWSGEQNIGGGGEGRWGGREGGGHGEGGTVKDTRTAERGVMLCQVAIQGFSAKI